MSTDIKRICAAVLIRVCEMAVEIALVRKQQRVFVPKRSKDTVEEPEEEDRRVGDLTG